MSRKLSLTVAGCMALVALGVVEPGAFAAEKGCNGLGLPMGIYPPSDPVEPNVGKFDVSFTPTTAGADAEIYGGAVLCGTNTATNTFYKHVRHSGPSIGEGHMTRCASPYFDPCPALLGGDSPIPDGSYVGSATNDVYCDDGLFSLCLGGMQFDDVDTKIYVRYDTSGKGGPNRCVDRAPARFTIGCFQAEGSILTIQCDSDIIYEVVPGPPRRVVLTFYQPDCELVSPVYVDTTDNLHICKYAGAVGGSACGTDPAKWLNRNGDAGPYAFDIKTLLTTGSGPTATAAGAWTY